MIQTSNFCHSPGPSVSTLLSPLSPLSPKSQPPAPPQRRQSQPKHNPSPPDLGKQPNSKPRLPKLNTNPFATIVEEEDREEGREPEPPGPMACMTSVHTSVPSYEEPVNVSPTSRANPSSLHSDRQNLRSRRRHSYHVQPLGLDGDNVNISQLLDRFLTELDRRLSFLDTYADKNNLNVQISLDSSIERAWSTLHAVRESCANVSTDVLDAGRRRAKVMIDTVESRYKGALATRGSLEAKAVEGVRMIEGILSDFEARVYELRSRRFSAASSWLDSGRRLSHIGLDRARASIDEGLASARRAKDKLQVKIEAAITRAREVGLLSYEDLPHPWQGNPHILKGYRFTETWQDCLWSIVNPSNEMFNIWSHLIGLVVVLAIALYIYPSSANFSNSTNSDILVAGIFFLAACKCLAFSILWHTMSSISCQKTMERFACVDYTGISLLVGSSIITTEYTAFYCEPISRWIYMSATAILGICGTIAPWHPTFNRADLSWARVAFYVTLSGTGFIPVFQLLLTRGMLETWTFYAPICKSLAVYMVGAILYASKIPERWVPGAFDYFGGSHNIWHVAVLGGILFHYNAMQEFFRMAFDRVGESGGCSVY